MTIKIIGAFRPLFKPKRYKVYYGGRGGAKSYAFAQALLIIGAKKQTRILCTREYQGSLRDSVHRLLCDTIERLGLQAFYTVTQTSIIGKNGTTFIFEGLKNNVTKIKSMEGIDICWCEEAEAITEFSWDTLIPTIRKSGSEIWVSFNPFDEMDATYQSFVVPYIDTIEAEGLYENGEFFIRKVGYRDNPYFPEELRLEMEKCKKTNYNKYLHIWEGQPSCDFEESIIKPEWVEAAINSHTKLGWKPRGVKTIGFDPADTGTDSKAYCARHGSLVYKCEQWTTGDLEDGVVKVYDAALDLQCTDLVYDSIGIGAGAKVKFNQLKGHHNLSIQGFCGSETPEYPERKYMNDRRNADVFRNRRAQGYWYLRDRFEATYRAVEKGEYCDPEDLISIDSSINNLKQLKSELTRIQRKVGRNENSLIQIESKKDMASRGIKSPNLADALMYTFMNKAINKASAKPLDYSRM